MVEPVSLFLEGLSFSVVVHVLRDIEKGEVCLGLEPRQLNN
jgi:hypothetical protein